MPQTEKKAKKKTNRLKATFWTEEGARHQIDAVDYKSEHLLAIYRLTVGAFTKSQMDRIRAILDEKKE